ncbi:probable cyclin-dependent serine/threonine-protein kinase DDB_G0292550 [Tetranychus urticae]|uniref:probable cyclin-dependent serine/threonine-protein kinase DDB_G0292550 n=1 Tax=Tetranychus urticae TaxID=32264 RepID=UPI00077B96E8|nr:probable cyclin-dependent serine/threonine-protein kinase DDB_G0292550 [Tetranychus urticae]XP_015788811.1 probable cyclin-dependent serine/threonine-protein kinase DDB_G0292550 [Tetranychus urticae]XP_015788813.1 probable cyclin-dependent serine/threonine-protein kinase DDB_G0292550 [Tetranychus urticae]XP_015788814.1 probable cyclin-dependent serine/threonine-protein kinase DDB_G0292550 [Tetranychus urticae]XP_015788815.1 probable cyclin-dependent serine/threonine-protein kinase DDB_G02925
MRQIEEEDDTPATCPEESHLTTLNVSCRGVAGRGDGISGIPGENGIPGGIGNLECSNHNIILKGKPNQNTTSSTTINTSGTVSNVTTTSTNMRKTKRSPNERRFKCDQCDRMFFTRKDVKRHLVVHTGVRNYACPFCQQRFGRKDHLVRHAKKSHQKDTRASASTNNVAVSSPNVGATTSPISHHHRRLTFSHNPVHHGLPGSQTLNHHHPGRMIVNVNGNLHNNNNGSGNSASLSPCNYSSSNLGPVMEQSSPIMLLGSGPGGNINGTTGGNNNNVSSSLTNCSTNGSVGVCATGNGNGIINNNHHDLCYPTNANHHNGSMASPINDGHFGGPTTMGHHSSLCETPLFNSGSHYFSLGATPTPFMNPSYITNCFGHITVNPSNTGSQGLTSVSTMCSGDQTSPVSCTNALSHLDVNLTNHLHQFSQVFH